MPQIEKKEDTIVAIATPLGTGAIGIVRLSGPEAIAIVDKVFTAKNKKSLKALKTFSCCYGWIVRDKTKREKDFKDSIVDEAIVLVMRAPATYTREDVVEIHAHGGFRSLSLIMEAVLEKGARMAAPGEFTRRAFLNGRIDLTQAEAVLDVISAKSDLALKNSQAQLTGVVSHRIAQLRASLVELLAQVEAKIDFSEETVESSESESICSGLDKVLGQIEDLLKGSFQGQKIREGLKVVIYGRPNVGKSSLLNAILKQERAIVTPVAGTTRDTIEEVVNIKGFAVRLIDTAGILEHRDAIEKEAIARTQRAIEESDLVLLVFDSSEPLSEEDRVLADQIKTKKFIIVLNKCDQPAKIIPEEVARVFSTAAFDVSAQNGSGIALLEEAIFKTVFEKGFVSTEHVLISNIRHIDILRRAFNALKSCRDTLEQGYSLEFAAPDLKRSVEILSELTGEVRSEEVLDLIFSKFCIGK